MRSSDHFEGFTPLRNLAQILLQCEGMRVEGLVLAASVTWMRIAVPDQIDLLELRLVRGQWTTETGSPVEIEALSPIYEPWADAASAEHDLPVESLALAAGSGSSENWLG